MICDLRTKGRSESDEYYTHRGGKERVSVEKRGESREVKAGPSTFIYEIL